MRTGMGWMDGWMDEWMVPDTGGISYVQVDRSVNKYLWSSSVKTNKTRTHHSSSGSNLASPLRNRNGARHGRRSALCKWRDGWASLLQKWILSWDNMPEQWYVGRCWGLLTRKKKKKERKNKNYSTEYSHVVPHHSTDSAINCLTAQIGRDAVGLVVYGRNSKALRIRSLKYPNCR